MLLVAPGCFLGGCHTQGAAAVSSMPIESEFCVVVLFCFVFLITHCLQEVTVVNFCPEMFPAPLALTLDLEARPHSERIKAE